MVADDKGRKSPRAQVSLVARYRSPTAFEFVEEQCSDLSAGGMFIKSPAPAPAGTLIKLECEIDHGAHTLRGVARVVWLREVGTDSQPPGMGVKFVKLEAGGREAIQGVLQSYGAELKEPADASARRSSPTNGGRVSSGGMPALAAGKHAASRSGRPNGSGGGNESAGSNIARLDEPFAARRSDPRNLAGARAEAAASAASVPPMPPLPGMSEDAPTVEMPMPAEVAAVLAKEREREASANAGKPVKSAAKPVPPPARPAPPKLPVPQQAALESPSGRPLIYIALVGCAVAGVYAWQMARRTVPETASSATVAPSPETATPALEPPPAQPEPAAAPQAAPPTVLEPPPPAPPKYVLEVSTTPEGASISANGQTLTAPGSLELGLLEAPVRIVASKTGYENASTVVDRVGFMLDEGQMRRRIVLALTAQKPAPEPPAATPSPSAKPASKRKPTAEIAKAPARKTAAARATPPEEPVAPVAQEAPPAAPSEPAPVKAEKQTPMEAAAACLATGDNACVVKALEGRAKSAHELELLIETYRTLGEGAKAEQQMQTYLAKYPSERRANGYRRVLENRKTEGEAAPE